MSLRALSVQGYRSLRDLTVPLGPVTVISGGNGTGKSSLYRALRLLAESAQGRMIAALAAEGGFTRAQWAGPESLSRAMRAGEVPVEGVRRRGPVSLRLGFASEDLGYAVDLGLPLPPDPFPLDPQIKLEAVWFGDTPRKSSLIAERRAGLVHRRDGSGRMAQAMTDLPPWQGMLAAAADPRICPELSILRDRMRGWRFYDHLRADPAAPARRPCIITRTNALAADGGDLAAAIETIHADGDGALLHRAVADAFPDADLLTEGGLVAMAQRGMLRPLLAPELSEGTLRYLMLCAALLSPRPPELIVLNEPESSLHPDLIAPLARLIETASARVQVLVVTHARPLAAALEADPDTISLQLEKEWGETRLANACRLEVPAWVWLKRQGG